MDTGEIIIIIYAFALLISWLILLIYFSFKRRDLSHWKIALYFTIAFITIRASLFYSISTIHYGNEPNGTELVGLFIFTIEWFLIPIISGFVWLLRRFKK